MSISNIITRIIFMMKNLILVCLSFQFTTFFNNCKTHVTALSKNTIKKDIGAYIHIPFCRRRCFYCDFPIQVVGENKNTIQRESDDYVNTLLLDIDTTMKYYEQDDNTRSLLSTPLSSIYFGGGTPSLLSPILIEKILNKMRQYIPLSDTCEITMETDPGTFNKEYLLHLESIGITRLSLGLQSFTPTILTQCGRPHTVDDIYTAISTVHDTSFSNNFNIDIISSLPQLTLELWQDTLNKAIELQSTHISVYDLQIEERTAFGRWYTPGTYPLPTENDATAMYKMAVSTLTTAGFEHYEVSNYAKAGKRSQHNQKYWNCVDVFGFGMGAAAMINQKRYTRPSTRNEYHTWVHTRANLLQSQLVQLPSSVLSANTHNDDDDENAVSELITAVDSSNIHVSSKSDIATVKKSVVNPTTTYNLQSVTNVEANISIPIDNYNLESTDVDILEHIMLSLRTADGLSISKIAQMDTVETIYTICLALQEYIQTGVVQIYYLPQQLQKEADTTQSTIHQRADKVILEIDFTQPIQFKYDEQLQLLTLTYTSVHKNSYKIDTADSISQSLITINNLYDQHQSNILTQTSPQQLQQQQQPYIEYYIRLSDPDGFVISNTIISSIFAELSSSSSSFTDEDDDDDREDE